MTNILPAVFVFPQRLQSGERGRPTVPGKAEHGKDKCGHTFGPYLHDTASGSFPLAVLAVLLQDDGGCVVRGVVCLNYKRDGRGNAQASAECRCLRVTLRHNQLATCAQQTPCTVTPELSPFRRDCGGLCHACFQLRLLTRVT